MSKSVLVCSWLAGNLFNNKSAGGSEQRAVMLFNNLNNKDITFFVKGNEKNKKINNINVCFCSNNIFKIIKRYLNLIKKTDIVCIFAINRLFTVFVLFAKLYKKKIIYFLTCDADIGEGLNFVPNYYKWHPKLFFPFIDVFVAQTEYQQNILQKKYKNKKIFLLKNPVIINPVKYIEGNYILWVGRHDKIKGIDLLKKIILNNPEKNFKIVGINKSDLNFNYKNVIQVGRVNQTEINKYYIQSKFVINTSEIEGFTNVFLQSFANKKPIVSYKINPDNFLEKSDGGICANGDLIVFQEAINDLYYSEIKLRDMGQKGCDYIKKNHDIKVISKQFNKIMTNL